MRTLVWMTFAAGVLAAPSLSSAQPAGGAPPVEPRGQVVKKFEDPATSPAPTAGSAAPATGSAAPAAASPTPAAASPTPPATSPPPSAAGSAAPAAGTAEPATAAAPDTPAPPPANVTAQRHACEAALVNAKNKGDNLFVLDVSHVAQGAESRVALAKTADGAACLAAIEQLDDFRASAATAANQMEAEQRDAATKREHEDAARAIAKNQKHVVMAYAALWILSVGFVLFLWRRQQGLKTEIAQLKRDLEAASK